MLPICFQTGCGLGGIRWDRGDLQGPGLGQSLEYSLSIIFTPPIIEKLRNKSF